MTDNGDEESIATHPPVPDVVSASDATYKSLSAHSRHLIDRAMEHDNNVKVHAWTPRKIVFEYENDKGDRCFTILFVLSAGAIVHTDDGKRMDNSGVNVQVTDDGWELTLAEKWHPFILDAELFYHKFPMAPNETVFEYDRRRHAMMKAVKDMKANSLDQFLRSEFRMRLPFRVDPDEKRFTFTGTKDSLRVAAVDLFEKKKVEESVMSGCIIADNDDSDSESEDEEPVAKLSKRQRVGSKKYRDYVTK